MSRIELDEIQKRLSRVMLEWYTRDPKMHADIRPLVDRLDADKEYYVRKAVLWIRRNFLK